MGRLSNIPMPTLTGCHLIDNGRLNGFYMQILTIRKVVLVFFFMGLIPVELFNDALNSFVWTDKQ